MAGELVRSATPSPVVNSKSEKTAVIYLRVSSTGQVNTAHDPEGYSIPSQREICERHATSLGAKVIAEYVEPGKSATTTNRPALQTMLAEIGETQPDFVIFYDLSRAARDEYDALWLLKEITALGCKLESTQERVDNTESGMLLYTVMSGVNAFRSRNDGKKIKTGIQKKFEAGGTTGPARLGYLNVREQVGNHDVAAIGLDPERAPLVRMAFDLILTGQHTVSSITEILREAGLRSRPSARRPSKPLGRASIHKILTNDYYAGIVTRHGEKRDGLHEGIVSTEEFEMVQKLLISQKTGAARGTNKHHHYLSGHLVCSKCESRWGYSRNKGKMGRYYEYFTCLSRVHPRGACGSKYLRLDVLESEMERIHRQLALTPEQRESVRIAVRTTVEARVLAARQESERHAARVETLARQQQKLVELYYEDAISVELLQEEQARIESEKADARRWQRVADVKVKSVMRALESALTLVDQHDRAYSMLDPHERRMMNRALFQFVWVDDCEEDDSPHHARRTDRQYLSPSLTPTLSSVIQVAKATTKKAPEGAWQIPDSWLDDFPPIQKTNPATGVNRERGSNRDKLVPPRGQKVRWGAGFWVACDLVATELVANGW